MQGFSREETTANQNGASPARSLPTFPNREPGGAGGWVSFFSSSILMRGSGAQ
jgi:hypothetical protein